MSGNRDPIREWRERFGRQMLNLDFQPLTTDPFHASFKPIFDGMRMVRTWFSPGLTKRDDELVRDGDDSFTLLISRSKSLEALQRGRQVSLNNGEATLVSVDCPGDVGKKGYFSFEAMMLPRAEMRARVRNADDLIVSRIDRRSEPLRLLRAYMRVLEKNPPQSDEVRESLRRHILDLVGLAVTTQANLGDSDVQAVMVSRTEAAFDHIGTHYSDPNLSLASVAQALGISPRYLQKLFERAGTSFVAQLNGARLRQARELLLSHMEMRISDIALQCGFSDISHFNRLFRAQFGDTPGGVRGNARRPL